MYGSDFNASELAFKAVYDQLVSAFKIIEAWLEQVISVDIIIGNISGAIIYF